MLLCVLVFQELVAQQLQNMIRMLMSLLVAIVLMFVWGHWAMTLVVLGTLPIVVVAAVIQVKAMSLGEAGAETQGDGDSEDGKRTKTAGQIVGELVNGIRTVTSFNQQLHVYDDFKAIALRKQQKEVRTQI